MLLPNEERFVSDILTTRANMSEISSFEVLFNTSDLSEGIY